MNHSHFARVARSFPASNLSSRAQPLTAGESHGGLSVCCSPKNAEGEI
ncbi:hypothetical protein [Halonotius pteroides]|nr:hypothetical protein [Halonotius pteroides]